MPKKRFCLGVFCLFLFLLSGSICKNEKKILIYLEKNWVMTERSWKSAFLWFSSVMYVFIFPFFIFFRFGDEPEKYCFSLCD